MNQPLRIEIPKSQPPPSPHEEDKIGREDRSALLCCHEPAYIEYLTTQLRAVGYKVHHARSHQQAAQRLAGRSYHLTVLLENLEGCLLESNSLLRHLTAMQTDERRATFVVLLCQSFATGDELEAYAQSVDLLINYTDVGQFGTLLVPAMEEHQEGNRNIDAMLKKAA